METIYVTYNDGTKATFTGTDLSAYWEDIARTHTNAACGDYYKPGKTKPRLVSYFGNIRTTLPL